MVRELETDQYTMRSSKGLKQLTIVWSRRRPLIVDAGCSKIGPSDEDNRQRLEEMHVDDCEAQEVEEEADELMCFLCST